MKLPIAVDLNGGDYAPHAVIKGMEISIGRGDLQANDIAALGTKEAIDQAQKSKHLTGIKFVECPQQIDMGENREKIPKMRNSSIAKGLHGVKTDRFCAFVSAGNTSAMILWGTHHLSRIKPRLNPAIAVPMPNESGPCLLLDSGAIPNATVDDLASCAIMGTIYAQTIWKIKSPTVRLLNIGREDGKGSDKLRMTQQKLRELCGQGLINFQGNIEGDKILLEPANVIVCSGEIGNNAIKVAEGVKKFIERKLGLAWTIFSFFYNHHKKTDYQEVGGAILLGVNGVEIIAHGKSAPLAIANAIRRAKLEVESNIIQKIAEELG